MSGLVCKWGKECTINRVGSWFGISDQRGHGKLSRLRRFNKGY